MPVPTGLYEEDEKSIFEMEVLFNAYLLLSSL